MAFERETDAMQRLMRTPAKSPETLIVGSPQMRIEPNASASQIPQEDDVLKRLQRVSRLSSGKFETVSAVMNLNDEVRFTITTFSDAEDEALCTALRHFHFDDSPAEEVGAFEPGDETADLTEWERFALPGFDAVYRYVGK